MKKIDPFDSRGLDPADFRFGSFPSEGNTNNTFKLQVHLNAVEYADLINEIRQYEGAARDERIKELLHIGLQADQVAKAKQL
jgi:hypothetical protein